mmetsp:Transcript_21360/g.35321  ORF Transcript_21360/g.35321 Transcript_21360/m.35321 type:complete len:223 (+) Transcript_21360:359-1027(+)
MHFGKEPCDALPILAPTLHPCFIMGSIFHNMHPCHTSSLLFTELIKFHHMTVWDQLILCSRQVQNRRFREQRCNHFIVPSNAQHETLQWCYEWHEMIDHFGNAQIGILDNETSEWDRVFFGVMGQMKGHTTTEGSTKEIYLSRIDSAMSIAVNESKSCFGVEFQTRFVWFDCIGITVSSILHHENVAFQMLIHLNSIGESEANVTGISVEEDEGRYLLRLRL